MAAKEKTGVTTSQNVREDLSADRDHIQQGDTLPATSTDLAAGLADESTDDLSEAERAKLGEKIAKDARKAMEDKAGIYKIVRSPMSGDIPLSINGKRRDLEVGKTYKLGGNEVEILEGANIGLERVKD